VARGYRGRPELTDTKFIPDPFSSLPGARLYRTGDLVRWRPDGQLDYRGRVDRQVKIRGYRIELEEIEAVLNRHPDLERAVVEVREDQPGDKRIVAFMVPRPQNRLGLVQLREQLRSQLPAHMIPSSFRRDGDASPDRQRKGGSRCAPCRYGQSREQSRSHV
jgi:acyl-coenzyme A synthetase/AMP-(fatty) acid ligase